LNFNRLNLNRVTIYSLMNGITPCNYLDRNKADNGIFNFSVWSRDTKRLFPGDSKGNINIVNGFFYIFISGYKLKATEYFTWEVTQTDSETEIEKIIDKSPQNIYYKTNCFTNGFWLCDTNGDTNTAISFSNKLNVKIHIYNLASHDPFEIQGDFGTTTINILQNTVFTEKFGTICPSYLDEHIGMPIHSYMKKFTNTPLCYQLSFEKHETLPENNLSNTISALTKTIRDGITVHKTRIAGWTSEIERLKKLIRLETAMMDTEEETILRFVYEDHPQ
jgi:hypothetical protein